MGPLILLSVEVRYTYRLRPGQDARAYLFREWGACRWIWNRLVAESRERHLNNQIAVANGCRKDDLPTFGYAEQDKFLTHLRQTTTDAETGEKWLAHGSSVAQQQTVRDFAAARSKAIADQRNRIPVRQRRGLPRFKSRRTSLPSMNYTTRGFSLKPHPETGRPALALPGKVLIPIIWTRELPSSPKSARVYQDSIGDWHVSFVVKIDEAVQHLPRIAHTTAIGIDWGVTETATTALVNIRTGDVDETTEFDLPHKQHGKSAAATLSRYQRMMSRRRRPKGQDPSKGYQQASRKAARAHKKVARQRQDDARKWAKNLVHSHDRIAVEDFKPKFLAKSTMAKKAADAAIAATKTELIWQAKKAGRDLRLVHPSNTTTDCSNCDARTKHRLPLGERTYTCDTCGLVRPRDKNSAAVMVVRAGFSPADVEDVSPEPAAAREPAV